MVIRFIIACFICTSVFGADKFVRPSATGATGNDWTAAYTNLTQAEAALSRGDTLWVADGTYAGDITWNVAESSTTAITIKKATVASHGSETGWDDSYGDGQATCDSYWAFTTGYWIIDGGTEWPTTKGFKLVGDSTTPVPVRYGMIGFADGDNSLTGVWLLGTYTGAESTATIAAYGGGNLVVSNCWFNGSPWEDHVYCLQNGGSQQFYHCRLDHTGHPVDGVHRDLENVDSFQGTVGGFDVVMRDCIVAGDYGDAFLFQNDVEMGNIRIENSVFSGVHRALGFGSGSVGGTGYLYFLNNTLNDSRDYLNSVAGPTIAICSNNVYQGYDPDVGGDPCGFSAPQYCAWTPSTGQFIAGTGNLEDIDPLFVNSPTVDGADGIPFTSDDGFNITSTSPLRDAGILTDYSKDILGNSVQGPTRDIGAYEYVTSSSLLPIMNVGTVIQR